MPIEIRELKIKAVISPLEKNIAQDSNSISPAQFEQMKSEIIKECLSQVKEYLKEQKER